MFVVQVLCVGNIVDVAEQNSDKCDTQYMRPRPIKSLPATPKRQYKKYQDKNYALFLLSRMDFEPKPPTQAGYEKYT